MTKPKEGGVRWTETETPRVFYLEHPLKVHDGGPDRAFSIEYELDGKSRRKMLGWASTGWSVEKAVRELERLRKKEAEASAVQAKGGRFLLYWSGFWLLAPIILLTFRGKLIFENPEKTWGIFILLGAVALCAWIGGMLVSDRMRTFFRSDAFGRAARLVSWVAFWGIFQTVVSDVSLLMEEWGMPLGWAWIDWLNGFNARGDVQAFMHACDYVFLAKFVWAATAHLRLEREYLWRVGWLAFMVGVYAMFDSLTFGFFSPYTVVLVFGMVLRLGPSIPRIGERRSSLVFYMFFLVFSETLITRVLFLLVVLDNSGKVLRWAMPRIRWGRSEEGGGNGQNGIALEHLLAGAGEVSASRLLGFWCMIAAVVPVMGWLNFGEVVMGFNAPKSLMLVFMLPLIYWMVGLKFFEMRWPATVAGILLSLVSYQIYPWLTFNFHCGQWEVPQMFVMIPLVGLVMVTAVLFGLTYSKYASWIMNGYSPREGARIIYYDYLQKCFAVAAFLPVGMAAGDAQWSKGAFFLIFSGVMAVMPSMMLLVYWHNTRHDDGKVLVEHHTEEDVLALARANPLYGLSEPWRSLDPALVRRGWFAYFGPPIVACLAFTAILGAIVLLV